MKQAVNFRLSNQSLAALSILEEKLHISRTAIIEEAVKAYAKSKITNKNPLLAFAGVLNKQQAEDMLHIIKANKHDKDFKDNL